MENTTKSVLNELSYGRNVQLIGKGNSMSPLFKDGETMLIKPLGDHILKVKDVVLVRVQSGKFLTHQILDKKDDKYTISNITGKIDDIVTIDAIYGLITKPNLDFDGLTFVE